MVVALMCGCLINELIPIQIVLGISVSLLFLIKGYYIVSRFLDWLE